MKDFNSLEELEAYLNKIEKEIKSLKESIGAYYFESEKMAKKAIKEVGEERIKKYLFGVEE